MTSTWNRFAARIVACAVLATLACTHHDDVTVDRCTDLRDHLVDLRVGEATRGQAKLSEAELADHRASLSNALGESFVQSCVAGYTPQQLRCSLAAAESADAITCANTPDKERE